MSIRRKGLMIILDGVGDRPHPRLGGRTPLEIAHTPNLDRLAEKGQTGMVHPVQRGVPVGTHLGTGLLMGLAPADIPLLRRGPIAALGSGMSIKKGNVALRCNFATIERDGDGYLILDRRAGRISEGTDELAQALSDMFLGDGFRVQFRAATQHRAVLLLDGEDLSEKISDTDPGAGFSSQGVLPATALDSESYAAFLTAERVNRLVGTAHEILQDHPVNQRRRKAGLLPANGILTREAGMHFPVRNLLEHLGLSAAVVAGEETIIGLGKAFGYKTITRDSFSGLPGTDIEGKISETMNALASHSYVVLHFKGTDTAAHDRNPEKKAAFLEEIDAHLSSLIDQDDLVVSVTGDHSTDSNMGRHTGDPVPSILFAPDCRTDEVSTYNELSVGRGNLGALSANEFLWSQLDLMNVTHNLKPRDFPFLSGSEGD